MWNAGVNVHYLFPVADAITLYPGGRSRYLGNQSKRS